MNAGTQQRDRVAAIAKTKPREALELAQRIEDPWFRCQALSHAAMHAPDQRSQKSAIDDAFSAANELHEPTVSSPYPPGPSKRLAWQGTCPAFHLLSWPHFDAV